MTIDRKAFERLLAKDEIRDLVLLYSRGCYTALSSRLFARGPRP